MKANLNILIALCSLTLLSGCLTFQKQAYDFDYETGMLEINYHDVRSVKDDKDGDDYLDKDWAELQTILNKKDDFDPQVAEIKEKTIFQDGDVLSGKAVYQVRCPKCFPAKKDLLNFVYDEGRWEVINDEIFLIVSAGQELVSCNGKLLKTEYSTMCAWPQDAVKFQFAFATDEVKGESLLSKYLSAPKGEENSPQQAAATN